MRFDPDYGCQHHGTETCTDPDCIRAAGGSVYAEELRQAEDLLDAMDVETWLTCPETWGTCIDSACYDHRTTHARCPNHSDQWFHVSTGACSCEEAHR